VLSPTLASTLKEPIAAKLNLSVEESQCHRVGLNQDTTLVIVSLVVISRNLSGIEPESSASYIYW